MPVPQPIATFSKDPQATLDYTIDWSDFLGDDVISAVTWTLDAGIVDAGHVSSRALATIFLSGGVAGTGYNVTCHITTSGGRADDRTIKINAVDR